MKNFAKLVAAAALATVWLPSQAQDTRRIDQREANQQARIAQGAAGGTLTAHETQRLEKEAERTRLKAEREQERLRLKAERDAERERLKEETRRQREEERARREAERDAFRKAKEAEQNRIRTERAAARRALEGRVAKASGRAAGGARASTTTRVYSPRSIPDQSGTRRGDGSPISTMMSHKPRLSRKLLSSFLILCCPAI